MSFKIENRLIGPDQPPFIIAELSANHNGSLERALETVDAAHHCGADAIKLWRFTPWLDGRQTASRFLVRRIRWGRRPDSTNWPRLEW